MAALALLLVLAAGYFLFGRTGGTERTSILTVATMPSGARLFLNGAPVGSTPVRDLKVEGETAQLRVEMEGYAAWDTSVQVTPGEPVSLIRKLNALVTSVADSLAPPGGGLTTVSQQDPPPRVAADPRTDDPSPQPPRPQQTARLTMRAAGSGAMRVRGQSVTSGAATSVPAGTSVSISCGDGRTAISREVRLAANESREFTCHFNATVYFQAVAGDDTPSAAILINGSPNGLFTPSSTELGPGTYRISAQRSGYEAESERTITVKPSFDAQTHRVVIEMRKLDS